MNFLNTTVFITGANRGIGKALVEALLEKGCRKIYAAARDIHSIQFKDPRVILCRLDITDSAQIKAAVQFASDTEILINNAGSLNAGTFLEGSLEGFRKDIEVNYFSTIQMMRAFTPILQKNVNPRIVNIVSIAKYVNFPFIAGYSASKAALYSATQAARIELSPLGIAVHAVNPGAIDTDMNKGSSMPMTPPAEVALSILKHIESEEADIVPDRIGLEMFQTWQQSPMALEQLSKDMFFGKS